MYKIYISSPVSFYQRDWNNKVSQLLISKGWEVFLPQDISPKKVKHSKFEKYVFDECINMISQSDCGLLLLPYGRDCAWEVGYYAGLNKPIYVYVSENNPDWESRLRDWMIKGSINGIITDSKRILKSIQKDLILNKVDKYYLNDFDQLPGRLSELVTTSKSTPNTFLGAGAVITSKSKVLLVEEDTDSKYYYRRKGMWGFPTITVNQEDPIISAATAAKLESGIDVQIEDLLSIQNIPGAVGLFYKVKNFDESKKFNGKWFDVKDLLNGEVELRPTYKNVLLNLI